MLPGTNRSADRFARMSFYTGAVKKTADANEAAALAFSMIRNASVPIGISTPDQPNISNTLWQTVSDHKNRRYFFESVRTPNVFWVNLADLGPFLRRELDFYSRSISRYGFSSAAASRRRRQPATIGENLAPGVRCSWWGFSTKIVYLLLTFFSRTVHPSRVSSCLARGVASPRSKRIRWFPFSSGRMAKRCNLSFQESRSTGPATNNAPDSVIPPKGASFFKLLRGAVFS